MYKSNNQWIPELEVPAECCYLQHMSGRDYVEIRIPEEGVPEEETVYENGTPVLCVRWKSFMVKPEQVFRKNNQINVVTGLNKPELYICEHKMADRYSPVGSTREKVDVFTLMSRLCSCTSNMKKTETKERTAKTDKSKNERTNENE